MIEGIPVEEYIRRNADPIWLLQEGRWDDIENEQSGGSLARMVYGRQLTPRFVDNSEFEDPATDGGAPLLAVRIRAQCRQRHFYLITTSPLMLP